MTCLHRDLRVLALFLVLQAIGIGAPCAVNRAVVIGIDDYSSSARAGSDRVLRNLRGSANDARAIWSLLSDRYGFLDGDIRLLVNTDATRDAILLAIREHLGQSRAGDVALFYYSGHGSRAINPQSNEPGKMDETIVPADASKGSPDIRDKELRRLFAEIRRRDVEVIAIFDSCHSGSITRGYPVDQAAVRYATPTTEVGVSGEPDGPTLASLGGLTISASLANQVARETVDDAGVDHGAFTLALLDAIRHSPRDISVERLLARTRARLKANGFRQEPTVDATDERRGKSLLGAPAGAEGAPRIQVLSLDPDKQQVVLAAGAVFGLEAGARLQEVDAPAGEGIRLQISEVLGASRSLASVIRGDSTRIAEGRTEFTVDTWAYRPGVLLRLWWPAAAPPLGESLELARSLFLYRDTAEWSWIEDPTEASPTHIVARGADGWKVVSSEGAPTSIGPEPSPHDVQRLIPPGSAVYMDIPPPADLIQELDRWSGEAAGIVEYATSPEQAHYRLVGRFRDRAPVEFSWVGIDRMKSNQDPLPARSKWLGLRTDTAITLQRLALSAGRIRAWLNLEGPPSSHEFPYQLQLRDSDSDTRRAFKLIPVGDYDLYLVSRAREPDVEIADSGRRFIYAFSLSPKGETALIYPSESCVKQDEAWPPVSTTGVKAEYKLGPCFKVRCPDQESCGAEVLFFLTTREKIRQPSRVFSGRAFRSLAEESSLGRFLAAWGTPVRSAITTAPADWSIERIPIITTREVAGGS